MNPTLHIQLLGGFRLTADDAPGPPLDSPRLQALLAYLLLQRDAPHARAHLAFQLWPDTTEAQAHANLRTLLHRLRHALPDVDLFLHIDAQTVQWRGDASFTLDVANFERALAQAAAAEQVGDQSTARASCIEAVERYRGDLLPEWYDDWVLVERERLRQAFLAALERLILVLEPEREYAMAITYAQRLLRHDPLHEATYQHLMRLHALSGDRASALRIYHTCATVLERELAVAPSPATRAAYERLLHMEAPLAAASDRPTPHPPSQLNNLPITLTSFIGRARERAEVTGLLTTTRLLTLTGAGGCGKTRLALVVASDLVCGYPDGVWLVELAALTDGALVPQAVATVLDVREQPQHPLTATLVDALRPKELVLLLDNCEHLLDSCAHLAETLLNACPHLHILVTSREALGVAGETTWFVPSLALPAPQHLPPLAELTQYEAVQLFVERATAALPTFTLTQQNALDVAQTCRRLDGIPLAIELAAARVKVISVEQLAARLDDCFRLLTSGSRTALPRHQTLRAAIDWSYDLLAEPERALFRRLAVFAGGWILEAAEAVCAGEGVAADEVLELLAHLVDKSLVVVDLQVGGAARYRLLETVRQYSQNRLRESGETESVRRQHARFYLSLAEESEPKLTNAQRGVWLERLEGEHDNLRAALRWAVEMGDVEMGLRLAGALFWFWFHLGYLSEGRRWSEVALALTGAEVPAALRTETRAKALRGAAGLAFFQGDFAVARALGDESVAIERELGDKQGLGLSLIYLGMAATRQGQSAAACSLETESVAIFREVGDQWHLALSLTCLGHAAWTQPDYPLARSAFEESVALWRELEDRWGLGLPLIGLGEVARCQGDYRRAEALFEEGLALHRELGHKAGVAFLLHNLAHVALYQGEEVRAAALFRESLALSQELGDKLVIAACVAGLAGMAGVEGQPQQAARLFGAAEALRETIGAPLHPAERTEYERYIGIARARLDEEAFAAAWAAGRAMSLEQAIAEAVASGA